MRSAAWLLVRPATSVVGLAPVLLEHGHDVRALARNPDKLADVEWRDRVKVERGDLGDTESLIAAFDGVDVVYYLVHSMGTLVGFRRRGGAVGAQRRRRGAEDGRETAGVSGWAAPVRRGSVTASAVTGRGR